VTVEVHEAFRVWDPSDREPDSEVVGDQDTDFELVRFGEAVSVDDPGKWLGDCDEDTDRAAVAVRSRV
jgi:hypothetical protein